MRESLIHSSTGEIFQLLHLAERAYSARSFDELPEAMPIIAQIGHSPSAFLYVDDPRVIAPITISYGFSTGQNDHLEDLCCEQLRRISTEPCPPPIKVSDLSSWQKIASILYPLRNKKTFIGILGLFPEDNLASDNPEFWAELIEILSTAIDRLAEHSKTERQLSHLNTYLTVSTMLAQPLGLSELLETILYACIEVTSAEEGSILLLDDDKKNFCFYQVEGPSKPILIGATFPADKGIAGSVLEAQQSEIIDDVQNDPRFYGKIDSESGFQTKNMIAIPLTAGGERIGILEVLNKVGGQSFNHEDHRILLSIAEEIAFAIRNATVFEYVVNSYCKQRQGLTTCKGCKRPLGSWTPCVKYRSTIV